MRVAKWGNSLAVRLPVALVQELGISNGDELLLQPAKHKASQPARVMVERKPGTLEQLLVARTFRAPWPSDFAFDRDDANAR
jgi:antitoxin MazE